MIPIPVWDGMPIEFRVYRLRPIPHCRSASLITNILITCSMTSIYNSYEYIDLDLFSTVGVHLS